MNVGIIKYLLMIRLSPICFSKTYGFGISFVIAIAIAFLSIHLY